MTVRYVVKSAAEMKIGEPHWNAADARFRRTLDEEVEMANAGELPDGWPRHDKPYYWNGRDAVDWEWAIVGAPISHPCQDDGDIPTTPDVKHWDGEPLAPGQHVAVWRAKAHGVEQLETVRVIEVEYERQRVGDEVVLVAKSLRCEGLAEISVPIGKVVR